MVEKFNKKHTPLNPETEGMLKSFVKTFNEMSSEKQKEFINDLKKSFDDDKKMKLPSGKIIKFNDQQYEGIKKIRKWLSKPNEQFFTLAGYAGTGKSTIIKKIIDEYNGVLVVSAPTHKAKKVIMSMTGRDGETLHALLGLRPDINLDDFNPNDPKFNPIAPPRISNYNLVIIDEASMINRDLFNLIKSEIDDWKTIKVLFMGDPAQIPPIGEKESVVFNSVVDNVYELTEIMRQEDGNPLFSIYDALRNNLSDFNGGFERKTQLNTKKEGIVFTKNKKEFRNKLIEIFNSKEFLNNIEYAKLIAWRNITVMQSNKIIREIIFGKNVPFIVKGDILMGYRSIRSKMLYFNIIDNSADYRVMQVSKRIKNKFDLWGYEINLRETLPNNKYGFKKVFIVDHNDFDNLHNYAEIHDGLKIIAKNKKNKNDWKKYYEFRRESLIMTTITEFRNGQTRNYDDVIVKDLDYGYAITGHKAQGSTYKYVFILEDDININSNIKERNQIKYVALTRPTTTAFVLTNV